MWEVAQLECVCVCVCAHAHTLTCVPYASALIGSQADKLFILGVDFSPFSSFASLLGLSCCCIWPINNVILNQRLLRTGVITSSIIWPHLSLYCKLPSLGPRAERHRVGGRKHTHTFIHQRLISMHTHALHSIILECSGRQTDRQTCHLPALPIFTSSPLFLSKPSQSDSHYPVLVPRASLSHTAHLWEHFHSGRWLTSSPHCDSSAAQGK